MMRQQRLVAGTILRLRCHACGAAFPHFLFSGEQDTDTSGLCSVSSCDTNEVVIAEAGSAEWNDFARTGASLVEKRLSQQLARNDLRVIHLLRVEPTKSDGAGMDFREFKASYKPPILIYSCACCGNGESQAIEEMTLEVFQKTGGRILAADNLVLV